MMNYATIKDGFMLNINTNDKNSKCHFSLFGPDKYVEFWHKHDSILHGLVRSKNFAKFAVIDRLIELGCPDKFVDLFR